jgi:hypothetical protein
LLSKPDGYFHNWNAWLQIPVENMCLLIWDLSLVHCTLSTIWFLQCTCAATEYPCEILLETETPSTLEKSGLLWPHLSEITRCWLVRSLLSSRKLYYCLKNGIGSKIYHWVKGGCDKRCCWKFHDLGTRSSIALDYLIFKLNALRHSETSVNTCKRSQSHIAEDLNPNMLQFLCRLHKIYFALRWTFSAGHSKCL